MTTATVYRLVTPEHVCPYGLKTIDVPERHGVEIDDRHLETEAEAADLRERLGVETTPQTFVSLTENLAMTGMAVWMAATRLL